MANFAFHFPTITTLGNVSDHKVCHFNPIIPTFAANPLPQQAIHTHKGNRKSIQVYEFNPNFSFSCGYLVGSLFNEVDEPNLARNGLVRIGSESRLQRWSFYPLVVLLFIFACIRSLFASLFDIMRLRSGTDTGDSPVRRSARVSVRENETIYQNNTTRIIRER